MPDLPEHFGIGIDAEGNGPVGDDEAVRIVCWCGDNSCEKHNGADGEE